MALCASASFRPRKSGHAGEPSAAAARVLAHGGGGVWAARLGRGVPDRRPADRAADGTLESTFRRSLPPGGLMNALRIFRRVLAVVGQLLLQWVTARLVVPYVS